MISRDAVLENILEGDELIRFKQKRIMSHVERILWDLSLMSTVYTDLARDVVNLMFPDGNYIEFNHSLYYAVKKQINYMLKHEPNVSADTIRDLLTEMKSYAKAYDEIVFAKPGVYKYTSPWFDHIEEDTREWLGNEGTPMLQDFRDYLDDSQFDNIRNCDFFDFLRG